VREKRTGIPIVRTSPSDGWTAGAKKPMVDPVAPGSIVLGYELHDSLGLKRGDRLTLLGREFTVGTCYAMRGNKDDITAWIHLAEAQELLEDQRHARSDAGSGWVSPSCGATPATGRN
jgi:hypothetical protein